MAKFTIEATYRVPVFRQRTYEADTLEGACRLAILDDDWDQSKEDYESAGPVYVSGAWAGVASAYQVQPFPIPSQFAEALGRKASLFEEMLGMVKILAHVDNLQAPNLPTWLPRTQALIAKAEAVLAGEPDPEADPPGGAGAAYIMLELRVERVRRVIASVLETDPDLSKLTAEGVTDKDILLACATVGTRMDLAERIEAAEFRAALMAVGIAEAYAASKPTADRE